MVIIAVVIPFSCIAGILILAIAAEMWRSHRRSKLHRSRVYSSTNATTTDDIASHNDGSEAEAAHGKRRWPKTLMRGWRWKRILYRVGWLQIPSDPDDEEQEMHDAVGTRNGKGKGKELGQNRVVGSSGRLIRKGDIESGKPGPTIGTTTCGSKNGGGEKKDRRPTDIIPFENFGGYRYGDYARPGGQAQHYMAPLPVPVALPVASNNHSNPYHHPPGTIAEVEGQSVTAASQHASPVTGGKNSMDSGYSTPFEQDDSLSALPIPKDHPLCHHDPDSPVQSVCQVPRPVGLRNLAACRYEVDYEYEAFERASLVPEPLKLFRPPVLTEPSRDYKVDMETGRARDVVLAELEDTPVRPRLPQISTQFTPRHSHYESPLRQNPVEGGHGSLSQWGGKRREQRGDSIDSKEVRAGGTEGNDTISTEATSKRSPKPQVFQFQGEADDSPLPEDKDFHFVFASPVYDSPLPPPLLRIGVKLGHNDSPGHHHHRHASMFEGGGWTTVPLTPAGRSPGNPAQWSWTAEEFTVDGKKIRSS